MAEITVTNTDGRILEDITDALATARISGEAVFNAVDATAGDAQMHQMKLAGTGPKAMVRYTRTHETEAVEGRRHCVMAVDVSIAARPAGATTTAARITEILRLVNAAKNAVENTPPADAGYGGEPNQWHPRLQWGPPAVEADDHAPWVVARMKLEVSYTLDSPTSH